MIPELHVEFKSISIPYYFFHILLYLISWAKIKSKTNTQWKIIYLPKSIFITESRDIILKFYTLVATMFSFQISCFVWRVNSLLMTPFGFSNENIVCSIYDFPLFFNRKWALTTLVSKKSVNIRAIPRYAGKFKHGSGVLKININE